MSRVEVFTTEIKIESSDQSPFWEPIKRLMLPPNYENQRIKNVWLQFDLWPIKNQAIKSFRWSSDQAQFFWSKSSSWLQTLQQATYKWLPLVYLDEEECLKTFIHDLRQLNWNDKNCRKYTHGLYSSSQHTMVSVTSPQIIQRWSIFIITLEVGTVFIRGVHKLIMTSCLTDVNQ